MTNEAVNQIQTLEIRERVLRDRLVRIDQLTQECIEKAKGIKVLLKRLEEDRYGILGSK